MSKSPSGFIRRVRDLAPVSTLILFLTVPAPGAPAPPDSASISRPSHGSPVGTISGTITGDIGIAIDDAIGYFTAPISFGKTDWNRTATGAGAFGIVMAMDEPINRILIKHPDQGFMDEPLEWAKEWGRLRTMQYASLGTYFGGLVAGSDEVRVTGRLMGEALLLAGAPAITLQYVLGRSRPHAGVGAYRFNYFEWKNENQSLPSGHATVAFAISTVLAKRIDRVWAGVPLYTFAGLSALSMAWGNQHWPSDVLLGSALGYLAGNYVVSKEEERRAGDDDAPGGGGVRERFGLGLGPGGVTMTYIIY